MMVCCSVRARLACSSSSTCFSRYGEKHDRKQNDAECYDDLQNKLKTKNICILYAVSPSLRSLNVCSQVKYLGRVITDTQTDDRRQDKDVVCVVCYTCKQKYCHRNLAALMQCCFILYFFKHIAHHCTPNICGQIKNKNTKTDPSETSISI